MYMVLINFNEKSMALVERYLQKITRILLVLVLGMIAFSLTPEAAAQYNALAIGVEVGSPTGVTVLLPTNKRYAFEILGAWDLDDYLFLNAHALFTKSVDDYPDLHAIWGAGAFVGVRDSRNNAASVGVSGKFGAGYSIDPFEVYIHLTPRFELISSTEFYLGGGLGLRFFPGSRR